MTDENKYGEGPVYDLYYKHKYLINEEKYKNHKLTINVSSDDSKPGKMILSVYMVNNETGENILIESVDIQIEDTE